MTRFTLIAIVFICYRYWNVERSNKKLNYRLTFNFDRSRLQSVISGAQEPNNVLVQECSLCICISLFESSAFCSMSAQNRLA